MTKLLAAGLLLGALAAAPAAANDHSVRIDHHAGPVDAQYRAVTKVAHKQVGAVVPGGRASTLRCAWSAGVTVDREARLPSGATMTRSIHRDDVISGSRPGWCSAQREAISKDVAARTDKVRDHMLAVAHEDRAELHAELDRLHGPTRTG